MNVPKIRKDRIFEFIKDKGKVKKSAIIQDLHEYGITINSKTVVRDLKKLLLENFISRGGAGKNTYYYISPVNKIFERIDVEAYFKIPYGIRDVKESFNFDIFKILEGSIFTEYEEEKLGELHSKFVKNFSRYDSQTIINKEFQRIMIEFAWKSAAIEGNTYSLLATEALLIENVKDSSKTDEEAQMLLNHKDAFNEAIQNKDRFLTLNYTDLEYIHTVLTKKLGVTKNIRNVPVGVRGTKYKPLDNSFQLKEALENMVSLINKKDSFFEKSFLSLILLSYIQAFEDGNKRTARMTSNAILLANNSIPLSYRIVDVIEYKKASLLFYEINNLTYLKKIFIEQFEDAVNEYFC